MASKRQKTEFEWKASTECENVVVVSVETGENMTTKFVPLRQAPAIVKSFVQAASQKSIYVVSNNDNDRRALSCKNDKAVAAFADGVKNEDVAAFEEWACGSSWAQPPSVPVKIVFSLCLSVLDF